MPEVVVNTHKKLENYPLYLKPLNYWLCWTRFSNFADFLVLRSNGGDIVTQADMLNHKYQFDLVMPNEELYYEDLNYLVYRDLRFVLFYKNWFSLQNGEIYFFPEGVDAFLYKYSTESLGKNPSYFIFHKEDMFIYENSDYLTSLFKFVPSFCESYVLSIFSFYLKNIKTMFFVNIIFYVYTVYVVLFFRH